MVSDGIAQVIPAYLYVIKATEPPGKVKGAICVKKIISKRKDVAL